MNKKIVIGFMALFYMSSLAISSSIIKVESPRSKFYVSTTSVKTLTFSPTSHLKTSNSTLVRKDNEDIVNGIVVRTIYRGIVINCIDRTYMMVKLLLLDDKRDTIKEETFFDNDWQKPTDHSFNEIEVETVCNEGTGKIYNIIPSCDGLEGGIAKVTKHVSGFE